MPDWNLRAVILIIAAVQAIFVSSLLIIRNNQIARQCDRLLAFFLLAISATMSEHIAGWLGLYEGQQLTFFPFGETFLFAPLAYLYVKSITNTEYKWNNKEWVHFLPAAIYFLVHFFVWAHPVLEKQRIMDLLFKYKWGELQGYGNAFVFSLYLYKIIRHYRAYLQWLPTEYSNIEKLKLNWIRNFIILLCIYYVVFLGFSIAGLIQWYDYDIGFWQYFMLATIIYYTSAAGYGYVQKYRVAFDMGKVMQQAKASTMSQDDQGNSKPEEAELLKAIATKLPEPLTVENTDESISALPTNNEFAALKQIILAHLQKNKPYLDPELSLGQLAHQVEKPPYIVTQVIKTTMGKNFNDLINGYRVDAVIEKLKNGEQKNQTLLGIAYDCGFNSKATFNRAFKKVQNISPKEFIETL